MTGVGFPDGTLRQASSVDFLGAQAINTNGTQNIDITALILPSHVGLLFVWVASLAYLGGGVVVSVDASLNSVRLVPATLIGDGGETTEPFPGIYITDNAGNTCTLNVSLPAGTPGPALGNLLVFGVNATPLSIPSIRQSQIGRGKTTGAVTVAATSTVTVLAAPAAGTYYRIKLMSWRSNTGGASIQPILFIALGTGAVLGPTEITTAGGLFVNIACDFEWEDGIQVLNNSSTGISVAIVYELWSV